MTSSADVYQATDGAAYEVFLGRRSRRLAEKLLDFAAFADDGALLDVGCGTGSLTGAMAARWPQRRLVGVDFSEAFLAFARSRDLVAECGLTHLHVFPYSARPGTPAARMPQVPPQVRKERAALLRNDGAAALHRHLESEIGARRRVLVESNGMGRTEQFTPVRLTAPAETGTILDLAIAGHDGRQLLAA